MARVLVTGGTGMLGRWLVPRLTERGHDVAALSRRRPGDGLDGARWVQGDVLDGPGLEMVASGMDVIVHAASSPARRARRIEVEGTTNAVAAAQAHGAHLLYV